MHFFERKWADAAAIPAPELARQLDNTLASYGFTSVFDLGSPWENTRRLRERIEAGEVAGPHIRSTGPGLISPGAGPPDLVLAMMGVMKTPLPEIADVPHASEVSRKLLDEGADGIKIFLKPASACAPSFPDGALDAVVGEARLAGKPVFVHPTSGEDVLTAARSGVDVVAHTTPHSGPWTEAILRAMRDAGAALTPTLTLWEHFSRHDRLSAREEITKTAVGQLAAWNALRRRRPLRDGSRRGRCRPLARIRADEGRRARFSPHPGVFDDRSCRKIRRSETRRTGRRGLRRGSGRLSRRCFERHRGARGRAVHRSRREGPLLRGRRKKGGDLTPARSIRFYTSR